MSAIGTTPSIGRRSIAAVVISIGFVGLGLSFVDIGKFVGALGAVNPLYLAGVVALSMLMAILRAARVALTVQGVPLRVVFKASFLHGAANAVLPVRMGEVVLPITLARYGNVDASTGAGLLLLVRLCDLAALVGAGLILLAILGPASLPFVFRIAAAPAGLALVGGILVLPFLFRWLAGRVPESLRSVSQRLAMTATCLTGTRRLALLGLTLAIWLTLGLAGQIAVAANGLQTGVVPIWLACVAASLAFALPANGVASVGPFEAAFVGVLVGHGQPAAASLVAALSLHAGALVAAGLTAVTAVFLPGDAARSPICL